MQQPGETLQQFWHTLNSSATLCDFGEQTKTLVLDMFILHMKIKTCRKNVAPNPVSQQKGRRIPIQLQEQDDKEVEELLKDGHIEEIDKIQDDVFIQPTVIAVKKDKLVKIALDARARNESIAKDKYPMPNLDNIIDMIADELEKSEGEAWYSFANMTYAYGQIPLHELPNIHCNFQILGENPPSIYHWVLWTDCNAN